MLGAAPVRPRLHGAGRRRRRRRLRPAAGDLRRRPPGRGRGRDDRSPAAAGRRAGHRSACVVGLVGSPDATRAVARCLVVQAAVLHGPADLAVAALAPGPDGHWSWLGWLPHAADAAGGGAGALVAADAAAMAGAAEAIAADGAERLRLVVMDGSSALVGRAAPGRALLGTDRVAAIVVAGDVHELPASCTAHRRGRPPGRGVEADRAAVGHRSRCHHCLGHDDGCRLGRRCPAGPPSTTPSWAPPAPICPTRWRWWIWSAPN